LFSVVSRHFKCQHASHLSPLHCSSFPESCGPQADLAKARAEAKRIARQEKEKKEKKDKKKKKKGKGRKSSET
jgi:hypothetical protein